MRYRVLIRTSTVYSLVIQTFADSFRLLPDIRCQGFKICLSPISFGFYVCNLVKCMRFNCKDHSRYESYFKRLIWQEAYFLKEPFTACFISLIFKLSVQARIELSNWIALSAPRGRKLLAFVIPWLWDLRLNWMGDNKPIVSFVPAVLWTVFPLSLVILVLLLCLLRRAKSEVYFGEAESCGYYVR